MLFKCSRRCVGRELDDMVYNVLEVKGWFNIILFKIECFISVEAEYNDVLFLRNYDYNRILGIWVVYRYVKWEFEGKGKLEEFFILGSVWEGFVYLVRLFRYWVFRVGFC